VGNSTLIVLAVIALALVSASLVVILRKRRI